MSCHMSIVIEEGCAVRCLESRVDGHVRVHCPLQHVVSCTILANSFSSESHLILGVDTSSRDSRRRDPRINLFPTPWYAEAHGLPQHTLVCLQPACGRALPSKVVVCLDPHWCPFSFRQVEERVSVEWICGRTFRSELFSIDYPRSSDKC